ncbi:neutral zinc metallopeptidase, partial [Neisseria sp. P0004.S006]|uniref:neutral zinc metallopeptidase n=1 Tax=Neisseria sp. P0004.S006 TaxID=3436670 RepID=UPI003F7F7104
RLDSQPEADLTELSRVVLADTENAWSKYFQQHGQRYTPTTRVLYEGGTSTASGTGQSAMRPFDCPGDQKCYLDLSF